MQSQDEEAINAIFCGAPRSPDWQRVRREHITEHPNCSACGTTLDPEVHHKKPYHLFPESELDRRNLQTLCGAGGNGCHYRIGHCFNWLWYNELSEVDAEQCMAMIQHAVKPKEKCSAQDAHEAAEPPELDA